MKRILNPFGLVLPVSFFLLLSSCATQDQTSDATSTNKDSLTAVPVKTGPLSNTMDSYYKLKDAFVKTDGTTADMAATQLRMNIDSISIQKLQLDSAYVTGIASFKKAMTSSIDSLIKQRDMQQKRRQFQVISDSLYSLAKSVSYKGEPIYQVHCPMAFNNAGANWLNNQAVVNNPYFGDKMLECGEVVDSLKQQ